MIKLGTGIAALAMLGSVASASAGETRVIGGRPSGCPRVFCGCVISLEVFHRIIPRLNLAWNWVEDFQRASPGSGMVAARHGHAFLLRYHVRGDVWYVYDGNTGNRKIGRHKIVEHDRSIRGFTIVNPNLPKRSHYAIERYAEHG